MSDDLRGMLGPLKERLQAIEAELAKDRKAIRAKERDASRVRKGLAQLDPQWAAEQRRTRKAKTQGNKRADGSYAISDEKVETVEAYVRAHFVKEDFAANDLPLDELGMSKATRGNALGVLHDRSVLRLTGRMLQGGAKVYRLVSDA